LQVQKSKANASVSKMTKIRSNRSLAIQKEILRKDKIAALQEQSCRQDPMRTVPSKDLQEVKVLIEELKR